ncbi:hypothetical protein [Aquimarina brevivitae]|uniref:Lysine-specific metallo-endopeptidase family protein n=1 Tax=Aquimarina brevivitae TaxID=323412 RepID=A0A4Q7PH46_9FLAO|nr:hypothetical protein [Aquimarina brevivitae]RZS99467.1 hypothetical protein EV197_0684 [Aquimarina brevivitae]
MKLYKFNKSNLFVALIIFVMVSLQTQAQQTCSVPPHDNVADGTSVYASGLCNQARVDHWWSVFNMRKSDWDSGFGFFDPCNLSRPLARTFAAMYLLTYSAEDYATNTGDYSGNALRWAYPYTANNTGRLQALCYKPGSTPGQWAGWAYGNRVELYLPYFYNFDVVMRAGTLLHEARHNGGKSHNGGSGCPRGASCDTNWSYQGSNMYEVLYLWWFAVDGTRTTSAIRNMARNRARAVQNNAFNTNPGFNI